jgi:lysophospholipase L1-like esterase
VKARALIIPFAATLVLAGCDKNVTSTSTSASQTTHVGGYVALGDSYTAGPGIPTITDTACQRSDRSYPYLVADSLGISQVDDVSCSGAKISDLSSQVSALSSEDTIVTVGIGGNDVDFAGVLTRCVELDVVPSLIGSSASGSTPCEAYYTSSGTNQIEAKIQDASTALASALIEISHKAPKARIYVVGYPDLLPDGGTSCAHTLGITPGDLSFLNQEELRLNAMLKQRAQAVGAVYVDTYTPSVGHDACSDVDTRWTEPLAPANAAAPLHPNARGEQGMADAVLAAIKANS